MKNFIRTKLIDITGYYIYKKKDLAIGTDLSIDIKERLGCFPATIFDVGAHEGQTALYFDKAFKDSRSVIYTFEPVKATFKTLVQNTAHQKCIINNNVALGDANGTVKIKLSPLSNINSLNNIIIDPNAEGEIITVQTGDDFCLKNSIASIDLLKIDTEGYEVRCLEGFKKKLESKQVKLIYAEVCFDRSNRGQTFIADLIDYIDKYKFALWGLYELNNKRHRQGETFANALFVPKE